MGRDTGFTATDLGGAGAALGRGGGMLGRDGAGVEGRELGAEEPGTVLVLILILGPEEGIGECMGDGADITFGMLTGAGFGRGGTGAGSGAVAAVVVEVGACETVDNDVGVFATGACVGAFFGGDTASGLEGFGGSTGDSCWMTVGRGAGDAFREVGADIGAGEACLIGGEDMGWIRDSTDGEEVALPDVFDFPNLRDSFGFGGMTAVGRADFGGPVGAGGG